MNLIGITEAAKVLQMNPKTLHFWLRNENFPEQIKPILIGQRFKFNKAALEQYIAGISEQHINKGVKNDSL